MPRPMTPAEIAEIDQKLAMAGDELNQLIRLTRDVAAARGRMQAMADMTLALSRHRPAQALGLLMAAVWRLAWQEEVLNELPGNDAGGPAG